MKKLTAEELNTIIDCHCHWFAKDCEGWETMKANLSGAYLYRADLHGVNLSGADLIGADLSESDISGADLSGADLRGANLYRVNLRGANIAKANLSGAYLRRAYLSETCIAGANLSGADLCGANFYRADLRGAYLNGADLRGADLYGTDFYGADLYRAYLNGADLSETNIAKANLSGADLRLAENIPFIPMACPEEGAFIGYKKALHEDRTKWDLEVIVKLQITEDALRSSATGRKCRCSKAKVLAIQDLDGNDISNQTNTARSYRCDDFKYVVGEIVSVENFDTDRWEECAPGIHFFMSRQEAVEY